VDASGLFAAAMMASAGAYPEKLDQIDHLREWMDARALS
jgi:hypothetical protein